MVEVDNQNKKSNQYKWNHFNYMPMQSFFGGYHCFPLSHMAKSYIWLEKQRNVLMSFQLDIRLIQI